VTALREYQQRTVRRCRAQGAISSLALSAYLKGDQMNSTLLDVAGRRRSPATLPQQPSRRLMLRSLAGGRFRRFKALGR
jgi:hypothetical protein